MKHFSIMKRTATIGMTVAVMCAGAPAVIAESW